LALWNGRFSKKINAQANDFNSSLAFDKRLLNEDITGSIAHVTMLGDCEIIPKDEAKAIAKELAKMIDEELVFDDSEDIHSFIENELTKRLGDLGRKLHTARSRNDQVALDLRMYLKKEIDYIGGQIKDLINVLCDLAEQNEDSVMPGFTHLQHAQPITFAHHLMAYSQMFMRDLGRLKDCFNRMNESPLGSGALAGTTHPIDRHKTAEMLGFNKPCENSLDGVSDRDYCVELAGAISLIMVHLSRFCEEIILWASQEYKYIELDDGFATGSSIMPQKKNPDIAELIRGKCGRVFGDNTALLTMLKGLPLAYNKDMQEDKEAIFDSVDTVKMCLSTFAPMLATMRVNKENMRKSCEKGFINATDCADYLAKKGVPFRKAYEATGKIVAYCIENGKVLDDLSIEEYREFSTVFDNDVYAAISLEACVRQRNSYGGANTAAAQIAKVRGELIGN
jgi:argininosuccinate lyase